MSSVTFNTVLPSQCLYFSTYRALIGSLRYRASACSAKVSQSAMYMCRPACGERRLCDWQVNRRCILHATRAQGSLMLMPSLRPDVSCSMYLALHASGNRQTTRNSNPVDPLTHGDSRLCQFVGTDRLCMFYACNSCIARGNVCIRGMCHTSSARISMHAPPAVRRYQQFQSIWLHCIAIADRHTQTPQNKPC